MNAAELVQLVLGAFDKLQIPYMVVGSFSSNVYGTPRSTKDADFVVNFEKLHINALMSVLGSLFSLEPQMSFETITATPRYRIRHLETAFMFEIFQLSDDAHDRSRFQRRTSGLIGDLVAFVPTAEDVIITKLRWSLHGKRQKDLDDVRGVVGVQWKNLDVPYIRHWCDQHGTRTLFDQIFDQYSK